MTAAPPPPPHPPADGSWWRLALGVAAITLGDRGALVLVGLPLAGLLLAAGPGGARGWVGVAAGLGIAVATLAAPVAAPIDALIRTYIVFVSSAFVCIALVAPAGALRMAGRSMLWGAAATVVLATVMWGGVPWHELGRQITVAVRAAVPPEVAGVMDGRVVERAVAAASDTVPAVLALETLAGLALAWQLHTRLARRPLGVPLAPFREFRFGDVWVWAVVASATVWLVPALAGLRATALNVGVVLGVLYLVRGAAVITALATAAGVSAGTLAVAGVLAVLLAPLLSMVGITDTWLEFRRRLASRPTHL
jgi:predicted membrane protein DUF2232